MILQLLLAAAFCSPGDLFYCFSPQNSPVLNGKNCALFCAADDLTVILTQIRSKAIALVANAAANYALIARVPIYLPPPRSSSSSGCNRQSEYVFFFFFFFFPSSHILYISPHTEILAQLSHLKTPAFCSSHSHPILCATVFNFCHHHRYLNCERFTVVPVQMHFSPPARHICAPYFVLWRDWCFVFDPWTELVQSYHLV